jgi:hypothetical protein
MNKYLEKIAERANGNSRGHRVLKVAKHVAEHVAENEIKKRFKKNDK